MYPPPAASYGWQALLAGTAEFHSAEFSLVHPVWVDDRQYFLDEPWDPAQDDGLDMSDFITEKLDRSPEAFRKRSVAFFSRNLISQLEPDIRHWKQEQFRCELVRGNNKRNRPKPVLASKVAALCPKRGTPSKE